MVGRGVGLISQDGDEDARELKLPTGKLQKEGIGILLFLYSLC